MAYDGLIMAGVCHELAELKGARIERIHQPSAATLILVLHQAERGKLRLLLSAEPGSPRVHLTETKPDNPPSPPMFCMLLRKHLSGARLVDVYQAGLERILTLAFQTKDELGNLVIYKLIAEIMGRHSNIILVNNLEKVIDAINRVPPAVSTIRILLPGITYEPPSHQQRAETLSELPSELIAALQAAEAQPLAKALVGRLTGISPFMARELAYRANIQATKSCEEVTETEWLALQEQLAQLQQAISQANFTPCRGPGFYAAVNITHVPSEAWPDSINELVDKATGQAAARQRLERRQQAIGGVVRQNLARLKRTEAARSQELEEMYEDLDLKQTGELLLANLHTIPTKATEAEIINYYDPEQKLIKVVLDPRLTPVKNAQRYFRRYERARRGIDIVTESLEKTHQNISYLESVAAAIEQADSLEILADIEQELTQSGWIISQQKAKKKEPEKSELLQFTSPDGHTILVGRNNLQNERLLRLAQPDEWWFHTKDIPGSHVLVRDIKDELPEATLLHAASLAAYFSKAREAGKAPVDYTRRKYVRKPPGSPPGYVTYTQQRTVMVTPSGPGELPRQG